MKDSPVTSKIVNTDKTDKMDGPKVTKEGVRNPVTGRTTASVRFRPMPGQTAEKVLLEINKLRKEIKTRLRRLGATFETSSSSSSTFVTGNDDSTASDPKAEESPFQQTDPNDEPPADSSNSTKSTLAKLIGSETGGKYFKGRERASRNGKHCRLTFLLNHPPSNLFHCHCLVLVYSKHPNKSFFNPINIFDIFYHTLLLFL